MEFKGHHFNWTTLWVCESNNIDTVNSYHLGCINGVLKSGAWDPAGKLAEIQAIYDENELLCKIIREGGSHGKKSNV